MKNLRPALLIACVALAIAGCGNSKKDSTETADSANHARDSSNGKEIVAASHETSEDDAHFAVTAANGGMAEVELGNLAKEKAASAQVRDFGAMMVKDHSKANAELKMLADSNHISLPAKLNDEEQKLKDELSAKPSADFDKAYVDAMVDDHKKDIEEFERASKVVKIPAIKAFVDKTLPILKMHLTEIEKIRAQMK